MADDSRKSQLIAELARARGELATHTRAVGHKLDLAARFKASFRQHAYLWFGGAALLGLLLTRFPRRRKVVTHRWRKQPAPETQAVKAGLLITVLKIAFDIFRPALTKWIAHQMAEYTGSHSRPRDRR